MRKSRSETAETRARIVSVASQIFLTQGVEGVGMREVMRAAELTPGGFYRHFTSKDQLIAEAMQAAFNRLFAMFDEVTLGESPEQSLEQIVTLYLRQSKNKGTGTAAVLCPLAQLGSELANSSPSVRAVAHDGHVRLEALVAKHLSKLPRRDVAPVASTIVSLLLGAVLSAKLAPHPHDAARVLGRAMKLIMYRSRHG